MKYKSIFNFLLFTGVNLSGLFIKPVFSSITILNCSGNIPKKAACLIDASTYKVKISRIDICQKNPFPNYRITPDYGESNCINLLDKKISKNYDLNKLKIPTNLEFQGEYKYISLLFENKFLASGKYNAGGYFWQTSTKGPTKIIKKEDGLTKPGEFISRLTNWRGKENIDNKYCSNKGGTFSRCDLNYNGYQISAIGLGKDLIENVGDKVKYMFYLSELSPKLIINNNSDNYIELQYQRKLEVYGNGISVKSISIAPLIFKTSLIKNN